MLIEILRQQGLARLDQTFLEQIGSANPALAQRLLDARANPSALARKQQSELIIEIAPHVEDFIGELFGISADLRALQAKHHALAPIYALKRRFVQKKAISGVTKEQASAINGLAVAAELEALFKEPLTEASFVEHVGRWLDAEHEFTRTGDLRQAMWAFNEAVGSAAATWKQTVAEAIQQDNLF